MALRPDTFFAAAVISVRAASAIRTPINRNIRFSVVIERFLIRISMR